MVKIMHPGDEPQLRAAKSLAVGGVGGGSATLQRNSGGGRCLRGCISRAELLVLQSICQTRHSCTPPNVHQKNREPVSTGGDRQQHTGFNNGLDNGHVACVRGRITEGVTAELQYRVPLTQADHGAPHRHLVADEKVTKTDMCEKPSPGST